MNELNIKCSKCGVGIGKKRISGLCEHCYDLDYSNQYWFKNKGTAKTKKWYKEYRAKPKVIPEGKIEMLCSRCNTVKALLDFKHYDHHRSKAVCIECKTISSFKHNATRLEKYHNNPEPIRTRNKVRSARPDIKLQRRLERIKSSMIEYEEAIKRSNRICENPGCDLPAKCCDHKDGVPGLRGLLCHQCNTALGLLYESSDKILGLAKYLNTRTKR